MNGPNDWLALLVFRDLVFISDSLAQLCILLAIDVLLLRACSKKAGT